jgi:hypothetical protein
MIDLGTKVFFRAAQADGGAVSIALVTGWTSDTKANLAIKPDQAAWFDAVGVDQVGTEEPGAACWSAWIADLN